MEKNFNTPEGRLNFYEKENLREEFRLSCSPNEFIESLVDRTLYIEWLENQLIKSRKNEKL